jgi:uncharacterized repeat protein (TIGR03803 family)
MEWFTAAALLLTCTGSTALGQMLYQSLKLFDYTGHPGAQPHAALIQGTDGSLYGTTQMGGVSNAGTLFRVGSDGSGYLILHNFTASPDGSEPYGRLVQTSDGTIYGTTVFGGTNGLGTIFKIGANGDDYAVVHNFSTNVFDGQNPRTGLILGVDGVLYGTTTVGGTNGIGTIFKFNPGGTGFALVHSFATSTLDGKYPRELVQGIDGVLYAITQSRVASGEGTVCKISTNGTGYTTLMSFARPTTGGQSHHIGLVQGADKRLYGTLFGVSGISTNGALFAVDTNGNNYLVLHGFTTNTSDGQYPDSRVLQGDDGALYGTTTRGGTNGCGTVFRMNADGSAFVLLHSFGDPAVDGQWPSDTLLRGSDGNLYGTTVFGGTNNGGTVFKISTNGGGYAVLCSFNPFIEQGQWPIGKVIRGTDGALYGTTVNGGTDDVGTIFRFNPGNSSYAVLHSFSNVGGDGQWPLGGLVQGDDGVLYGTTSSGGNNGDGTVFRISAAGNGYAVLYSFFPLPDGASPSGTLAEDSDGMLYGITGTGGSNNAGTVFRISTNGSYTVLHHFSSGGADGWGPVGGLARGSDGALYGTTADGGAVSGGTVFKVNPDGSGYNILYSFNTNGVDGTAPWGGLVQGADSTLYGTTRLGGSANAGTVYRINTDGSGYEVLRNFSAGGDPREPLADLALGVDGTLYGTACYGGTNDMGAVFQIRTNGGNFAVVHSLGTGAGEGRNSWTGVFEDGNNSLYGTAEYGGAFGAGAIFKLDMGPPLIVEQPQDQTVRAGGDVVFNVTAVGGGLSYQWFFNSTPLTNVSGPSLALTGVARSNGGAYTVTVTNTVDGLSSSSATLTVQIPQILSAPTFLPDGSLRLFSSYADGWALQPGDVTRFEVQVSSNLMAWETVSNSLSLSNGTLILNDPRESKQPVRFYRVIEH